MHVASFLVKWRWCCLLLAALIAVTAVPLARQVGFDRSIENMFRPGDPILKPFRRLRNAFGGNEVVMAVYQDAQLLAGNRQGIRRCAEIGQRLSRIDGVVSVFGLDAILGEAIVDPKSLVAQRLRKLLEGFTHAADGTTCAIVCLLDPSAPSQARRETIAAMREVMSSLPGELAPGLLAGEPVMVVDGFQFVERDARRLGWMSTLLLSATMIACFRSIRWVVIPIVVVQWAMLGTRAALWLLNIKLSMVSSMLTAIITVVGIAAMVHVIVRYGECRQTATSKRDAVLRMTSILAAPVMWACLTDVVGFASLIFARVGPVHDYGVMMSLGALMVLVGLTLLVPGLILIWPSDIDRLPKRTDSRLTLVLDWLLGWVDRRRRSVGFVAVVLAVVSVMGLLRLRVETDFTKNFRRDSDLVRGYDLIESKLGGAAVCDIVVPAPPRLNGKYLDRIMRMENRLRDELQQSERTKAEGLTKVLSLADAIAAASPIDLESVSSNLVRESVIQTGLAVMQTRMPEFFAANYAADPENPDQFLYRVMLRTTERQPAESKHALIERIREISCEEFPGVEITGYFVLLTRLIDSVLRDQWMTFGIAMVGIALMMLIALRSLKLAAIALVPNVFPIILVMGGMGWLGLSMNLGAAMIAAVSIGLSIDSSIHYLMSYQRQRQQVSLRQALRESHQSVGRAVFFSTISLIVGFAALSSSQFLPTVYFGALVSLTMVGGMLGNLVLLPLLILMTEVRTNTD